jgi:hypothetical protein
VAVDATGNLLVAGTFSETARFDDRTATSAGATDAFLARYDSAGAAVWVRSFGGAMADFGTGVALDQGGDAFVTGTFITALASGSTAVAGAGAADLFVARVGGSGAPMWIKGIGGAAADGSAGVAVDPAGNVLVSGSFSSVLATPPELAALAVTSAGETDVLVAKLAGDGGLRWVRRFGSATLERAVALVADPLGNAILTGSASGSLEGLPATTAGFVLKLPRDLRP